MSSTASRMPSSATLSYHKINHNALSFFDLPVEVRNMIYPRLFDLRAGRTIHLVYIPRRNDELMYGRAAKTSSKYHTYLFGPQDAGSPNISALILHGEAKKAQRGGLLRVCRAIFTEIAAQVDEMNHFNVLAGSPVQPRNGYHCDLDVVPQLTLANIKRLNVSISILNMQYTAYFGGSFWWDSDNWQVIAQQMVRLKRLCFNDLDYYHFVWFVLGLQDFKTIFRSTDTHVYFNTTNINVGCLTVPVQQVRRSYRATRLVIPPLKELIVEGCLSQTERDRLVHTDFVGTRCQLFPVEEPAEAFQYDLVWS